MEVALVLFDSQNHPVYENEAARSLWPGGKPAHASPLVEGIGTISRRLDEGGEFVYGDEIRVGDAAYTRIVWRRRRQRSGLALCALRNPVAGRDVEALLAPCDFGAAVIDPDGRILAVNPEFHVVANPDHPASGEFWWRFFSPAGGGKIDPSEAQRIARSKRTRVFECSGRPVEVRVRSEIVPHTRIVLVSERPRPAEEADFSGGDAGLAERAREETERLAAVGRLSASVIHDLNNLLTVIDGFSEMLRGELTGDDRPRAWADQIKYAGEHARSLTSRTLASTRPKVAEEEAVDLGALTGEMRPILCQLAGSGIKLDLQVTAGATVEGDPVQFRQILLNLAANARDAMPQGGDLSITVSISPGSPRDPGDLVDRSVDLLVRDTGEGIPESIMNRIFDPYFTTKGSGGTGLGLATVRSIVQRAHGTIAIDSRQGHGTSIHIRFPLVPAVPTSNPDSGGPLPSGNELILIIDDTEGIRELMADVLRRAGYSVKLACDISEGRAILERYGSEISLIITDYIMLGGDVRAFVSSQSAAFPGMKFLVCSGHPDAATVRGSDPNMSLLMKPFHIEELVRKVRATLDQVFAE